jgi:demethylmenaquinone methyltransferase/2-methoxy-6-polyprenyl-1,4-benzoquinol methylase/phosphoethanolamine N-methyltransferase
MHSIEHPPAEDYVAETKGHTIHSWAKYYDTVVGIISLGRERRFRKAALELVDIEPGMNILDVGCGTGSLTIEARRKLGSEGRMVGIDPSSNMIDLAQGKAAKAGVEIDFQVGVIEKMNFPDDYFDLVLSSLMMHHLPDELKQAGLQEVHRLLKPNGTLLIIELDPSAFSLASLIHGHSSKLSAELEVIRQHLESAGYVSIENGSLKFRGFSYLRSRKPNSLNPSAEN